MTELWGSLVELWGSLTELGTLVSPFLLGLSTVCTPGHLPETQVGPLSSPFFSRSPFHVLYVLITPS